MPVDVGFVALWGDADRIGFVAMWGDAERTGFQWSPGSVAVPRSVLSWAGNALTWGGERITWG